MKNPTIQQRLFGGLYGGLLGNSRIPIRSNIYKTSGSGYSKIATSGLTRQLYDADRKSPLLGNAGPSKMLSSWYSRVSESKQYELLDISRLVVAFFRDYVNNFLNEASNELVTIMDPQDGVTPNQAATDRVNDILTKDIRLFDFIRDHLDEAIYYGTYYSGLRSKRDSQGHLRFHLYGLYDPVSVIIKRHLEDDEVIEEFIARGSDGSLYVLPNNECFYLGSPNLRLTNDLSEQFGNKDTKSGVPGNHDFNFWEDKKDIAWGDQKNREKVIAKEYYTAGEPIFYSNLIKVKELITKELLVSLLSLRDLCTPSILALMFDKGVPMETADELCTRVQKMMSSYNDLSSFLSAQFDVTSLIENILSQNVKIIPDYNATIQNRGLISTDKLGDKYLELLQSLDQSRQNVISPLGLPMSILDGTSGSKWTILQGSERSSSRVNSILIGIKESVTSLVKTIYEEIYQEKLDPSLIKLHILTKSTVEYNNAINTMESISGLTSGITGIITNALQTLEMASPLIDADKFVSYIQNMIKNVDPEASEIITPESIQQYLQLNQAKTQAQFEQFGIGGPQ